MLILFDKIKLKCKLCPDIFLKYHSGCTNIKLIEYFVEIFLLKVCYLRAGEQDQVQ